MAQLKKNDVSQIKSKKRVVDHGEVFTSYREVTAMLDMVKHESERITSRFLEPACGNGNFLAEVLRRKLADAKKKYGRFPADYEKFSVLAVSSLYGVDIQQDNVDECQARLYKIWDKAYSQACKKEINEECRTAVKYILSHNILCGNALDMMKADGTPITFAQWDMVVWPNIKRRDYRLNTLVADHSRQSAMEGMNSDMVYDSEVGAMMPKPIKEYPSIEYWRVHTQEELGDG